MKNNLKEQNIYKKKSKSLKSKTKIPSLFIKLFTGLCLLFILITHIHQRFFATTSNVPRSSSLDNNDSFTVCLDAGHGDWDYGAIGIQSSNEKDIVLAVTLKVGELLEKSGLNVVYTRTGDKLTWSDNSTENLYERVNISKMNNSDLFLSIHCNATDESSDYNGVETWYNPNSNTSGAFATALQYELSNLEYTSDRGIKYYTEDSPLAVLDHNPATSALVELGFISNYSDENYLISKSGQAQVANAIANAILNYKESLNDNYEQTTQ